MGMDTVVTIEPIKRVVTAMDVDEVARWLTQWADDPKFQQDLKAEKALKFFKNARRLTDNWVRRIEQLRLIRADLMKNTMDAARGAFEFEAAQARMAAQEAFVSNAARMAAVEGTKGTLVAGAGTTVLAIVVPIVGMIAVQVALGAPYYQARKKAEEEGYSTGFAEGFVTGLLHWELRFAIDRFWDNAVARNLYDDAIPRIRANSHNQGLIDGRAAGIAKNDEEKKDYLRGLRVLANTSTAGWTPKSDNWLERAQARQVQISYVIALAAAARRSGIIALV